MTAAATPQTFTAVGLRLDAVMSELLVAGVPPGPIADDIVVLASSEEEFTRWAGYFGGPDVDTAAAMAYEHCRTEPDWP
ncbi:hypothetical protein [Streptomyces sp. NPDC002205]|uniref:hypothetical protein n=1 Tax=Streptomyces sp. NPDC002205 TaxID=3154411 RepID=UPI00331832C5